LEGFSFLEGFISKDSRRQIDNRGEGVGIGVGGGAGNISRRKKTVPTSLRPPPSPSPSLLGERGRGEAVPEGWDIS